MDVGCRDVPLKRVSTFKYLGLIASGHSISSMVVARAAAAHLVWGKLMRIMVSRGRQYRAARLVLFYS